MSRLRLLVALVFLGSLAVIPAWAQRDAHGFLTTRDLLSNDASSNITLHNSRSSAVTVYGLYVRQFAWVNPGESCDHATEIYPNQADVSPSPFSANITAGAVVMPTMIKAGQSAIIGGNYLYNMIYGANYYVRNVVASSPPGCAAPGCTWGSDSSTYHWCIYLGAMAPVSVSAGYTANVPPAVEAASSGSSYDYNLISTSGYAYLGPISCNDQTLTCSVSSRQTQAF